MLLGFSLILLPGMFISYYNIIYFFTKNFFFECLQFSEYDIRSSYLSFGWKIDHPLSTYVTRGIEGGHSKCLQMRTGGEGYNASCLRAHLHYLFSCFCLMVSCFICRNLTLPSFFSNETNFCSNEISFFYFKLLFWTKVSQNNFSFNQLKS